MGINTKAKRRKEFKRVKDESDILESDFLI